MYADSNTENSKFHPPDIIGRSMPVAQYPGASERKAARLNFHHALMSDKPAAARDHLAALNTAIQQERSAGK